MKIYVLGTMLDINVSSVVDRLRADGVACDVLESLTLTDVQPHPGLQGTYGDDFGPADVALIVSRRGEVSFKVNGQSPPEAFLFWDKVKLMDPERPLGFTGTRSAAWYRTSEWLGFYDMVRDLFPDRVVNPPAASRRRFKPVQQRLAAEAGFHVPDTLVTTSKIHVERLMSTHEGGLIAKTVADSRVQAEEEGVPGFSITTTPVTSASLDAADADGFRACPHLFQERVSKDYELRIVYVDGWIRAFRIDSQAIPYARTDWRMAAETIAFEPTDLPEEVAATIRRFMVAGSYFSGSLDLVVRPDGGVVFLECNQDGSWKFLDNVVDGEIADAFADALKKRLLNAEDHTESRKEKLS